MRARSIIAVVVLTLAGVSGCGDDDTPGESCRADAKPGSIVACTCDDAGTPGKQMCTKDLKLTTCDCSSDTDGGPGGTGGSSGSGGASNAGTGGATSAGTGGAGMDGTDDNDAGGAGTQGDAGTMKPDDTTPPPSDGNQLSSCATGVDCNMGLDCYNAPGGAGGGFCSKTCDEPSDCSDLTGASFTCSTSTGICVVDCEGTDDVTSCPAGLTCLPVSVNDQVVSHRCQYAKAGAPTGNGAAWSACMNPDSSDCDGDLVCNGSGAAASGTGHCAQACAGDMDCTAMPNSGSIMPSCPQRAGGMGMGMMGMGMGMGGNRVCALDCSDDADGCPTGMSCVENRFLNTARCEFN